MLNETQEIKPVGTHHIRNLMKQQQKCLQNITERSQSLGYVGWGWGGSLSKTDYHQKEQDHFVFDNSDHN